MSNVDALDAPAMALPSVEEAALPLRQYLTFMLAGEEYALDILWVQEIRGWCRATRVPNSAEFMCGVINLRGAIIPIIDLRLRFGLPQQAYSSTTVVVVLRVCAEGKERIMGVVVDAMAETYNIPDNAILPSPQVGGVMDPEFVQGLVTVEDKMVVVLDVDALLSTPELALDSVTENDN